MARIKEEQIVLIEEVRDENPPFHTYKNLIGETISHNNGKWLIYFKSMDRCAYIEKEFLKPINGKAVKILYGT